MSIDKCNGDINKISIENKDLNNITELNYAKFTQRVFAYIIDSLIILVICLFEFGIINHIIKNKVSHAQLFVIYYNIATITNIMYFSIMESSSRKSTIGKRVMGIYVSDLCGNRITFFKSLLRSFIKFIGAVIVLFSSIIHPTNILNYSIIFQIIDFLFALFLPKNQAIHDLIAGTLVLSNPN